jgi:hypothetical protein
MTIHVNKNSNKNIINIKIGDVKKKRKRRNKKKSKPAHEGSYIINNVNPTIQPQYNTPGYPPPPDMIHPSVLHRNRPQHVDLTTQVERENIGRVREQYYNNIFANPNQPASNDILNSSVDNNNNDTINLSNPFRKLHQHAINNQMNQNVNQNADNFHKSNLLSKAVKKLKQNRDISVRKKDELLIKVQYRFNLVF